MYEKLYRCGPAEVGVLTPTRALCDIIDANLTLYNVPWKEIETRIHLELMETRAPCEMLAGSYLTAQRIRVDATRAGLAATSPSGASAFYDKNALRWTLFVPKGTLTTWPKTDIEHLISLVVTTAWRQSGWVPLHAGAVADGNVCALLCATSGGGKTSLTTAMIRRNWKTLGDDKLLLGRGEHGAMTLKALVHAFNLYPHARRWFPEVGDLTHLPRYSEWTEKRKVLIEEIWPGQTLVENTPTHLVSIVQDNSVKDLRVCPLSQNEVLSLLLRQTVIPTHHETAARILEIIASTAKRLKGISVRFGEGAYHSPDTLIPLEKALS